MYEKKLQIRAKFISYDLKAILDTVISEYLSIRLKLIRNLRGGIHLKRKLKIPKKKNQQNGVLII